MLQTINIFAEIAIQKSGCHFISKAFKPFPSNVSGVSLPSK